MNGTPQGRDQWVYCARQHGGVHDADACTGETLGEPKLVHHVGLLGSSSPEGNPGMHVQAAKPRCTPNLLGEIANESRREIANKIGVNRQLQ